MRKISSFYMFILLAIVMLAGCSYNEAAVACDGGACGQGGGQNQVCTMGDFCSPVGAHCSDRYGDSLECACTHEWVPQSIVDSITCGSGGDCDPGDQGSCETVCGSTGSRVCRSDGTWSKCFAPHEVCDNDRDDDCDGQVDEGCNGNPDYDPDSDGYYDDDCEPYNASIHPNATEKCNGVDDDCDGQVDEGDVCGSGGNDPGTYQVEIAIESNSYHVWCEGAAVEAYASADLAGSGNQFYWFEPWHSFGCNAWDQNGASYYCSVTVPDNASLRLQCYMNTSGTETSGDNVRYTFSNPSQFQSGESVNAWENGVHLQYPGDCFYRVQGPDPIGYTENGQVDPCQT